MDLTFGDLVKTIIGGLVVFVLTEVMKFVRADQSERHKTRNFLVFVFLCAMAALIAYCLYWWAFIKTGPVERWEVLGSVVLLFWFYKIPDFIWYIRGNRKSMPPLFSRHPKLDTEGIEQTEK